MRKIPRCARSRIDQASSQGRRTVIATQPAVVAGGMTTWTRSPLGSDADNNGEDSSTRCRVEFAINLASRQHQSKSASGKDSRCHPAVVSMKTSEGLLMHSSVTVGSASSGLNGRNVKSNAEPSLCLEMRVAAATMSTSVLSLS